MKKSWNQPEIISLSIALTKTGNTTYWNETCIQENMRSYPEDDRIPIKIMGGEFQDCGKQPGAPLWYGEILDQGSQTIPNPPSAASAGS